MQLQFWNQLRAPTSVASGGSPKASINFRFHPLPDRANQLELFEEVQQPAAARIYYAPGALARNYFGMDVLSLTTDRATQNIFIRLYRARNIRFVGELVQLREEELLNCALGKKDYIARLKEALAAFGLFFNSAIPGWDPPTPDEETGLETTKRQCHLALDASILYFPELRT